MVKAMPKPDQIADDGEDKPRRPRRRLLLVIGGALLGIALAGGVFFLRGPAEEEAAAPVDGPIVEVAQMTVNLAGSQLHYARFGFAVVLQEEFAAPDVEERFPLLQDAALSEVQTFNPDVLRTPEGLDELRGSLTARAGEVYPDGQVLRVVLTEMVVQ